MDSNPINCRRCRYYYVTWDKKFPYGCKAMGFKTARLPSLDGIHASGSPCLHFQTKDRRPPGKKG